jgi:hypothetical protein
VLHPAQTLSFFAPEGHIKLSRLNHQFLGLSEAVLLFDATPMFWPVNPPLLAAGFNPRMVILTSIS